jgi:DNA polymerase-3 subunit delta'
MPSLSDIIGQDQAIHVLKGAASAGKVAHAYLFTGPEGIGKATTAIALAAALNCETNPKEGCEQCTSCYKIKHRIHPDLIHIQPDGRYIKIAQVRALEEHLGFSPHEGRSRLVIIDGADHLNLNAANALLKSLEEPQPRTQFVLVAAAGHQVIPTLVSRCQQIRFLPLQRNDVLSIIQRCSDVDPADQRAAAALAEGSVKKAQRLLEEEQMSAIQTIVTALRETTRRREAVAIFQAASEAGRDRLLLREALDVLRIWLRDLLLCREGLGEGRIVNQDAMDELVSEAEQLSTPALMSRIRAVDEAQLALRGNVHPTLALENLVLRMLEASP